MRNAVTKSVLPLIVTSLLVFAMPAFAGSANDPVSGLPLAPGMNPSNDPLSITICGKPAQANQYMSRSDTVATDITWYKAHLPGYHMVHAFWSDRSQDTFYSPDGTKGVNITGTPKSDRVFSVMYLSLKTGLTEHQWMVFSPFQSIVQVRSAPLFNFLNRRRTMKFFRTLMMLASLSVALSAGNVVLTTDPLTGLPIDPKSDPGMGIGNAPVKMDDMQICKSKMQANHYSVFDKVDPTVAWYAAHLTGFHKSHSYYQNRTQNAFYNDAGTLVVIVVGVPGKDGENVDTHAVTYYRFQPGLPAKAILSFGTQNLDCR